MSNLTVSAGVAAGLMAYAVQRGAGRAALLARAGLRAADLEDSDARLPLSGTVMAATLPVVVALIACDQCNGWRVARCTIAMPRQTVSPAEAEWQPVSCAPFSEELELAVIDGGSVHTLVFPCRRILGGWVKSETDARLEVYPTHWRAWRKEPS